MINNRIIFIRKIPGLYGNICWQMQLMLIFHQCAIINKFDIDGMTRYLLKQVLAYTSNCALHKHSRKHVKEALAKCSRLVHVNFTSNEHSQNFHVNSRLVLHYTLFTWITSCTWTFYQLNYSISYWINIAHAQSPLKRSLILRKEMTSRKTVWLSNFRWRDDLSTGIRHSNALISVRSLSLYLLDLKLQ